MPPPRLPSFDQKIAEQLEEHEGFVPFAYQDSLGYWTIGIGKLIDGRKGGGITHGQAVRLLQDEITEKETALDSALSWWRDLSDIRQRVLLDMAFNLGVVGLLKFRNTLAAIRRGDWVAAGNGMRQSLWYRQVGNRAKRLVQMMETNEEVPKWW